MGGDDRLHGRGPARGNRLGPDDCGRFVHGCPSCANSTSCFSDRMIAGEPADSLGLHPGSASRPARPAGGGSQSARRIGTGRWKASTMAPMTTFPSPSTGSNWARAYARSCAGGCGHFDGAKITAGALQVWPRRRVASYADRELRLQHKPFDVLRFLAENAGSTVSRKALWAEVWPHMNNRPP